MHYGYDEQIRLSELKEGDRIIRYGYDEQGRLKNKQFPNGTSTTWKYDEKSQLTELVHWDTEGILDRYTYMDSRIDYLIDLTREYHNLLEKNRRWH